MRAYVHCRSLRSITTSLRQRVGTPPLRDPDVRGPPGSPPATRPPLQHQLLCPCQGPVERPTWCALVPTPLPDSREPPPSISSSLPSRNFPRGPFLFPSRHVLLFFTTYIIHLSTPKDGSLIGGEEELCGPFFRIPPYNRISLLAICPHFPSISQISQFFSKLIFFPLLWNALHLDKNFRMFPSFFPSCYFAYSLLIFLFLFGIPAYFPSFGDLSEKMRPHNFQVIKKQRFVAFLRSFLFVLSHQI